MCNASERYDKLLQCIPSDLRGRVRAVNDESVAVMSELKKLNRYINALATVTSRSVATKKPLQNELILLSALNEPREALEVFDPVFVQTASGLIEFVLRDLKTLAKAAHECVADPAYPYLIICVIPAIFGNFVDSYWIQMAFDFYSECLEICDFVEFMNLSAPFFRCAMVSSYGSALYETTFGKNCLLRPKIPAFEKALLEKSLNCLKYLPPCHLELVKMIHRKWGNELTWKWMTHALIAHQLRINTVISPFEHHDQSWDVAAFIRTLLKTPHTDPIDIEDISSCFDTPRGLVPYGTSYSLEFVVSMRDIMHLLILKLPFPKYITQTLTKIEVTYRSTFRVKLFSSRLVRTREKYSPLVVNDLSVEYEDDKSLGNLWNILMFDYKNPMTVLQQKPIITCNSRVNLILENYDFVQVSKYAASKALRNLSDGAVQLDDYLSLCVELKAAKSWLEKCKEYLEKMSIFGAFYESQMLPKKVTSSRIALFSVIKEQVPDLLYIQKWCYIFGLGSFESKLVNPITKELSVLQDKFKHLVNGMRDKFAMHQFENATISRQIWDIAGVLSLVTESSKFIDRFVILYSFICSIENLVLLLGNGRFGLSNIIHFTIVAYNCTWMVNTVLFIEASLYRDDQFRELCDAEDCRRLNTLIVSLRELLACDEGAGIVGDYEDLLTLLRV